MHSVLWLILAFFNAAGLMLLVGAEFIAMLLVIVYVGAVAVLFLFVVMMLDIDFAELRAGFARYLPFGAAAALVAAGAEIIFAVGAWSAGGIAIGARARADAAGDAQHPGARARCSTPAISSSSKAAGLVLLVAMIGAIVLTHRAARRRATAEIVASRSAAARRMRRATSTSPASGRGSSCDRPRAIISPSRAILFVLGVLGIFLNRKNVIIILMAIELILLA